MASAAAHLGVCGRVLAGALSSLASCTQIVRSYEVAGDGESSMTAVLSLFLCKHYLTPGMFRMDTACNARVFQDDSTANILHPSPPPDRQHHENNKQTGRWILHGFTDWEA